MHHSPSRWAWLKLNSYGVLLCGLMLMASADIIDPEHSQIARMVGGVPLLQPVWTGGYVVAAVCILWGFARSQALPEVAGLALLFVANTIQTVVRLDLGLDPGYALTVWLIVASCAAARISALLSRHGLTVTIPGRSNGDA